MQIEAFLLLLHSLTPVDQRGHDETRTWAGAAAGETAPHTHTQDTRMQEMSMLLHN